MRVPRVIIAATHSRSGKTTIATGLMRAFRNRGLKVQPFKVGPDFIDPTYHKIACGRDSINLDSYLMRADYVKSAFQKYAKNADIAIIEGVMGLHDSPYVYSDKGSTASIARILKCPILLIVDLERLSRSAAAIVKGYKNFDKRIKIAGVILNKARGKRHALKAKRAIELLANTSVLGILPILEDAKLKQRYLGLTPAIEEEEIESVIRGLSTIIEKHVDVEQVLRLANSAENLPDFKPYNALKRRISHVKIGVLGSKAFSFYYAENLESLKMLGAELVFIDAFEDSLPDIHGLYIGGGFPELYAEELEKNTRLRLEILEKAENGMPIYAECGGLMYLCDRIKTVDGNSYEMVGFLRGEAIMLEKREAHGYVKVRVVEDNVISRKGDKIVGHEYHYSKLRLKEHVKFAYRVLRGKGIDGKHDGIIKKNVLASYLHIHVASYPDMFRNFLERAGKYKKGEGARVLP